MSEEVKRLRQLLKDAIAVIEFDEENCDFGPAYGMHKKREKDFLEQARKEITRGFDRFERPARMK